MKKPGTLIAIQVMAWIAIGFTLLYFLLASAFVMIEGTPYTPYSEFRIGFLGEGLGLDLNDSSSKARVIGYLTLTTFISLLKFVLVLIFIRKKLFKTLLVTLIVITIMGIGKFTPLSFQYCLALLIIYLSGIGRIRKYMSKPKRDLDSSSDLWKESI